MLFDTTFEHSEALQEAALAEFADKGYEQASINAILKAANMSKGQFYYHFENKEALYFALIGMVIARKQAFLASVMQPADFTGDLFSIFAMQIKYGLMFARSEPLISRFATRFAQEQGSPIYKRALAHYNLENSDAITPLIERALANGELRDDLPPEFIKRAVGYLFTHSAEFIDLSDPDTQERNLGDLIAFLRAGLGRQGGA